MPEAPVISIAAVASSDPGDEGSLSEGSSIEPGDEPGETHSPQRKRTPRLWGRDDATGAADGAMLLSQLRRR